MGEAAAFEPSMPLLASGEQSPLVPLLLHMEGAATQEEMNGNVIATLERGYVRLNEHLDRYRGAVSICGAAPSLRETWKDLRGDVMACNSAIGFLLERGVVPRWAMMWDAHPVVERFAVPHPDVTYLVGARCHPSVFERLKDCRVIVWHAGGDHNIREFMEERQIVEPLVNGGSAAVTRALYLAYALGYRDFHVFGADSSYLGDDTHVGGASLVPEKDMSIWVGNDPASNRKFRTTPEWCAQVEEFKAIYPHFLNLGANIETYGDGMLQLVHRLMKKSFAQQLKEQEACLQAT